MATLGTEFNTESGDQFDRILGALAEVGAPSVVAIGRDLNPDRFGPQPSHVRVAQYVNLESLIPRARVVLHHGGSGLFMRSVLGGAPQIVFPMGADQPFTADRIQELGVGSVLDAQTASSSVISERLANLQDDPDTRARVSVLRTETLTLPDPSKVVRRVEAIATAAR